MLVVFSSKASGDITMFGDVAIHLLKMMGMSGIIPGGIKPEEVPAALERLQQGISSQKDAPAGNSSDDDGEGSSEPPVNLGQRAYPLIEMLEAAAREECHVTWNRK